jgi:hypothetical protein
MQNGNQSLDFVAIISAIIALLSAGFAFWQASVAKKAYKLQKAIYEEGKANFAIQDIENSFLYDKNGEDKVYYFFKVILSNLSDKPTSISKIQLSLSQNNTDALIIACTTNLLIQPDLLRLSLPNNIEPHSSTSGWVVFEINRQVYKPIDIDTHYIIATDIHGVTVRREEISVREEVIDYAL